MRSEYIRNTLRLAAGWFIELLAVANRMHDNIPQIVGNRVLEAIEKIDEEVRKGVLEVWSHVGPGPDCPALADATAQINSICNRGLVEREKATRATIRSTIDDIGAGISKETSRKILESVKKNFPDDVYVPFVENTLGVYQRRQASPNKMAEQPFELELSKAKSASAKCSRTSLSRIGTDLDALAAREELASADYAPNWWQIAGNWLLRNAMKVLVGIITGLCVAALVSCHASNVG